MDDYRDKVNLLKNQMADYASQDIVLAFSGGVDSGLLLKEASDAVRVTGHKVYGILLHTMLHPSGDIEDAKRVAEEIGAEFLVLELDELGEAGIEDNPTDRCYRCKKYLFERLLEKAAELGVETVLEGTNAEDLQVYRPGIRAVRELGIHSPLADAGFTKEEVRRLAGEYGISVSHKPSAPCLATRFPYGSRLSCLEMKKVEQGETYLRQMDFYNVRIRVHGEMARIEVDKEDLQKVLEKREAIIGYLKSLGYRYIVLDLEGFRSGSMDIGL